MRARNVFRMTRRAAAAAFVRQELKKGRAWTSLPYAYDFIVEKDMYLGWFDDNAKKATETKIVEAIAAYEARFKTHPNVVLVNETERVEVKGIVVRSEGYIRKSNFWIGWEDGYA
jgi:hypothetical protein